MFFILYFLFLTELITFVLCKSEIEIYVFSEFPKSKIALHMPCEESNMFATKCMCHIKCPEDTCQKAINLCEKYSNRGCKYILLRKIGRFKVATLKRSPTNEELKRFMNLQDLLHFLLIICTLRLQFRFDISDYSSAAAKVTQLIRPSSLIPNSGNNNRTIKTFIDKAGNQGKHVLESLSTSHFKSSPLCGKRSSLNTSTFLRSSIGVLFFIRLV